MNEFHFNIINTVILIVVLSLAYFIIYFLMRSKIEEGKIRKRFKVRLFYGIGFVFILLSAKIWVDGFTHLLAVLSLVSAALVVTNKELVMNFVGGLIINWRGLFTEGDLVQLQSFSGFVYELGPLYFKLIEVSESCVNRTSGKMIKVPNGLVINNAITNFSASTNFLEYKQEWIFIFDTDPLQAKALLEKTTRKILQTYYKNTKAGSSDSMKKRSKFLAKLIDFDVHVNLKIRYEKPSGLCLQLNYYCYPKDKDRIHEELQIALLQSIEKAQLKLAFNN